jgi:hypothetical protein
MRAGAGVVVSSGWRVVGFYPQMTQIYADKGTSAGWLLCSSVTSVDNNGLGWIGSWFLVSREGAKARRFRQENFFVLFVHFCG